MNKVFEIGKNRMSLSDVDSQDNDDCFDIGEEIEERTS